MGSKIQITNLTLGDIRPYGWPQKKDPSGKTNLIGHEFELKVTMRVRSYLSTGSRRWKGKNDETVITWPQQTVWNEALQLPDNYCLQMPRLVWGERIRFYEVANNGAWTYRGQHDVDMFEEAPRAKTFGGFYPGISIAGSDGWANPWVTPIFNPGMTALTNLAKPEGFDNKSRQEKREITTKLFRSNHAELVAKLTDRPGMTRNPSGGPIQGGGGFPPLVTHNSRARVLHFALTFFGAGVGTVRCTQILESQNGTSTICKFINRRISDDEAERTQNHAHWRNQHDRDTYNAAGNTNFLL